MDNKTIRLMIFITMAFLLIGVIAFLSLEKDSNEIIGGDKDEGGCLVAAGYSWSEDVGACIRSWELNENQKIASKIAVDYVGFENGLTIIEVLVAKCPGCFMITLQKGNDRFNVEINNWEVEKKSMTPQECLDKGGRTVNIVVGDTCLENEINLGEVTGFISPNICCLEITDFDSCIEAGFPAMESYPRQCNDGTRTWTEELN